MVKYIQETKKIQQFILVDNYVSDITLKVTVR